MQIAIQSVGVAAVALVLGLPGRAFPWGGEHLRISAVAIDALPPDEQEYLRPERFAIAEIYCQFPDLNWPCYGQWGGGIGDPRLPRMPDTRRLWGISDYCQWDPVLGKGKGYSHAPPKSWEAAGVFFRSASAALARGRLEDGCRSLGVMLHYIEDSGSFPHVQPIHRAFHVKAIENIRLAGYAPQRLGGTPDEAAKAVSRRTRELTEWTERRLSPLLAAAGVSLDEAKQRASKELMPGTLVENIARLRADRAADYEAAAADCANQCAQACADAIHSVLQFAQRPLADPGPNALGVNLVFNPSFEVGEGDCAPAGWCVGWLDVTDRAGRAEWYRAGTHFEKHSRTGRYSALVLWPPAKGIDWEQTWPQAIRVRPEEKYRATVWTKTASPGGRSGLALEFSSAEYKPVLTVNSRPASSGGDWQRVSVDATAPQGARWLRVRLHGEGPDSATWFDDAEVVRVP